MVRLIRLAWMAMLVLILSGIVSALAAANNVPLTAMSTYSSAITNKAAAFAPSECSGMNLTVISYGSSGGTANELILGTAGVDNLSAGSGSDCMVGGDSGDSLNGGGGNDVILGGPGDDSLRGDQGTDACYGGPGNDTFHSTCETQVQ
jgi:hypothetical protein